MNEIWQKQLDESKIRILEKKQRSKYKSWLLKIGVCLLILYLLFPQYLRRMVYPFMFGKPTAEPLQISVADEFEDITAAPFKYTRGGQVYVLQPRTKYKVTGRVGIIDDYSTLRNRIFRGQFQGNYINLVPRDLFLVIGKLADPQVFKLFEFEHEERMGTMLCKGVEYSKSFMPKMLSEKEYQKSQEKYKNCQRYMNGADLNNYHPIPANERINKALSMLVAGDVVHLEGILVDVPAMRLNTGTRKNQKHKDQVVSGYEPGMCFILYTTKVILNGRVYE